MPADDTERRIRRALEALAQARADARQRDPGLAGGPAARRHRPPRSPVLAREGGLAEPPEEDIQKIRGGVAAATRGGRSSGEDPQLLGAAIRGLLADQGWQEQAVAGSMFGRWEQIVGPEIAAHARPDSFADGELVVVASSSPWAAQLRQLAPNLVQRLNAELGHGAVTRVKVRGPAGPRQPGPWRARGGRGPRDTYG